MPDSIHQIVRDAETNYVNGETRLGEHVTWSMYEVVERISAYLNSKHVSGAEDSLGREKPFFNIVTAAVNIWYRATDLDRKDIAVAADKATNVAVAFLASVHLQNWMKKARFGVFLNLWGRTLAQYGSAVVKFVKKDGELIASVVPWNRLIVDPVDFNALPRIEKIYKTPAQLRKMAEYDQDVVESLVTALEARETLDGEKKDNKADFVELYEVHGELPEYFLKDDQTNDRTDGKTKYRQQMHVIAWVQSKEGETQDFTLYKGREERDPYMITHLIEEDGRTLAIGAVEYLFDAQWMQNHTMKAWKDQMDLASKLVFQTADAHFQGSNVLSAIESGDIMIHDDQKPLELLPNTGHDVTNLQAFKEQWAALAREITSTPDAMRGNTLPSGTPYALGQLLATQSQSLFEIMTENKGLAVEDMLREFVIPFLKSKMDTTDEVAATLEAHDIHKLDEMYVPREAIRRHTAKAKAALLKGEVPEPFDPAAAQAEVRQSLAPLGNQRFFSPGDVKWKEALKYLEWELDVNITGEQRDKQAVMTTLSTVLQTIATNPAVLQEPNAKLVFNKILDATGVVSPVEISAQTPPPPQPVPEVAATPTPPSPSNQLAA